MWIDEHGSNCGRRVDRWFIRAALRAAGFSGRIVGVSRPATISKAIQKGAIDTGVSLEEAAAEADLLFLSQPVSIILETLAKLGGN